MKLIKIVKNLIMKEKSSILEKSSSIKDLDVEIKSYEYIRSCFINMVVADHIYNMLGGDVDKIKVFIQSIEKPMKEECMKVFSNGKESRKEAVSRGIDSYLRSLEDNIKLKVGNGKYPVIIMNEEKPQFLN